MISLVWFSFSRTTMRIWNQDATRAKITAKHTVGRSAPIPSGLGPWWTTVPPLFLLTILELDVKGCEVGRGI